MNKQIVRKLTAAVLALLVTVTMVVTVTYAWTTLSGNPVAEGLHISIGGGNTILVAADIAETVDGVTYHYPAAFSNTLQFNQHPSYQYLNELSGLSPVSTADGYHWYIPTYYDLDDEEVINGEAVVGQLKGIEAFELDTTREYANRTDGSGGYVMLDFWVVSPASDYTLRLSTGDDSGGSFLVELLNAESADKDADGQDDGYTLREADGHAAASARVGFLVNTQRVLDDSVLYYHNSSARSADYTCLNGYYPEIDIWYNDLYTFTIYEPNGDFHPDGTNGVYLPTYPLAHDGYTAVPADIHKRLTVQFTNTWHTQSQELLAIDLQNALAGKDVASAEEAEDALYRNYLQMQLSSYIQKGKFVQSTEALYEALSNGQVSADALHMLPTAGATDDVTIVNLEKNVPQRIRMFVWLEGQDADCTDEVRARDFALSIELAGSRKDENGD